MPDNDNEMMPSSVSLIQPPKKLEIPLSLVRNLIAEQFPQWVHLPIQTLKLGGWDNKTFRLGKEMSIRLPSAAEYALQVQKEHKWLPLLTPHFSLPIPEPLAIGQPSKKYPLNWSIYRWIKGKSANALFMDDLNLLQITLQLAQFLNELHKIDTTDAPLPGLHNYYRGAHPSVYDSGTRIAITQLQGFIDTEAATSVWEKAISSTWSKSAVWVHGDFSAGNILISERRLVAVIDFGCMGVGDPACDLVIAWTLLAGESRKIFKSHLTLDADTWARARGWALWKAMITMATLEDKSSSEALQQKHVIDEILNEHVLEKITESEPKNLSLRIRCMTQKLSVRKAVLTDATAIANIYLASRKKFIAFAPLAHSDESIYKWIVETLIPTCQVIVAQENGIIVGMMALSKIEGMGWIDQLYLAPDAVGRGIGTILVTTAKSMLGSPIRLHTFQENVGARRFYERHGFQVLEMSDGSANEENCPDVLYEWRF